MAETPIDSSQPPEIPPVFAKNQVELADLLGRDRKTIQRWLKIEGCPGHTADGRYNVDAWKQWIAATGRGHGKREGLNKLDIETRTALLKQEQLEIELAKTRGQLNSAEETCEVLATLFGSFVNGLRNLRHEVIPALIGETVPEATKRLGAAHDDLLGRLSLGDWAKKKQFWQNVWQRLSALQGKHLPSTGP